MWCSLSDLQCMALTGDYQLSPIGDNWHLLFTKAVVYPDCQSLCIIVCVGMPALKKKKNDTETCCPP